MIRIEPRFTRWASESAIRERLALLAHFGPGAGWSPHDWGYHSSHDEWYYCGPLRGEDAPESVDVAQEGSASLALILERWGLSRADAMALVGHPDR